MYMSRKLKKYCAECGNPVSYSSENKPKFCSACGSPMFGSNASKKGESSTLKPKKVIDGEAQDIDPEDMLHDIQAGHGTSMSSLDVETSVQEPISFKLGDIMPPSEEAGTTEKENS